MKKRLLATILALVMVLALLPTAALAAEEQEEFVIGDDGELVEYSGPGGDVVIPDGVTQISFYTWGAFIGAFEECKTLTGVTIPNSVTTIGISAFRGCTGLTSITIPNSVTIIASGAFANCTSLTDVTIPSSVTRIEGSAFDNTPWLEKQGEFAVVNGILLKYQGPGGAVTIPDSVTRIGDGAFWNCSALTSVTIPDSVTSIGSSAFSGCTGLTGVTIPDSVTSIGDGAFYDCTGLARVTIPNRVTEIAGSMFQNCSALTSVTIPDRVTTIGDCAFLGCSGLTNVVFPSSVTSVSNAAFKDTPWLEKQVQGVFAIVNNILLDYRGQDSVVAVPDSVTCIGGGAFSGCTALSSVMIPNSVTSIGDFAFYNCENLTSVTIPNSVTHIEGDAFESCVNLTDVYFTGTEEQWKAIEIYTSFGSNYMLLEATIHYNTPTQTQSLPANPTGDKLIVDGVAKVPTVYKVDGANYFKLRDVAALLNGTAKQFEVGYDSATRSATITKGKSYTVQPTDLQGAATASGTANPSNDSVLIDGVKANLTVYKINGANYFKLRDLGTALDFYVGYDNATKSVTIDTTKPYQQ